MLLLFLLRIAVLLRFIGDVHLSVKEKLMCSTLLLLKKNVSGPYPPPQKKKKFNNFCNFPSLFHPDGSIACSPTDKSHYFWFLLFR